MVKSSRAGVRAELHQATSFFTIFVPEALSVESMTLAPHLSADVAHVPVQAMSARARPVLDLVDSLRSLGLQSEIPIPQVAVMGDQSSGKSSVLEAISGVAFPRGRGLVTRCATQISMGAGPKWTAKIRAGQKETLDAVESPDDITAKIEELTNTLCGSDTFCADEVIEIQLRAPDLPELTLIDLPGIVRTTTAGQGNEVIGQVGALLEQYLTQPRTVILAVIPAPSDIATVDILERAAKVDPGGLRTVGVLTKPDLVDPGSEAGVASVLQNFAKPLRHGYFMLKNPSQEDMDAHMSPAQARVSERNWFTASKFASHKDVCGVEALTKALTSLLVGHIEASLPVMITDIETKLSEVKTDLDGMGNAAPENARICRSVLNEILRRWTASMRLVCTQAEYSELQGSENQQLYVLRIEGCKRREFLKRVQETLPGFDGRHDKIHLEVVETLTKEANGGSLNNNHKEVGEFVKGWSQNPACSVSRVGDVSYHDYSKDGFKQAKISRVDPYFRGELKEKIAASRGHELPGFLSFGVFKALMASYTSLWEPAAKEFQQDLSSSVRKAGLHFLDAHVRGYVRNSRLLQTFSKEFELFMGNLDTSTAKEISNVLEREIHRPLTMNHYLWDNINKLRDKRMLNKLNKLTTNEEGMISKDLIVQALKSDVGNDSNESQEVDDMLDMLKSYWKLAKKRFVDDICGIVCDAYTSATFLKNVVQAVDGVVSGLEDSRLQSLFKEQDALITKRADLQKKIERLEDALERIQEFETII